MLGKHKCSATLQLNYKTFLMKGTLTAFILATIFCTCSAQTITPNDSISTGSNYSQMVFYSLSTGTKTTASNTDWHLAVTTRPTDFPSHPFGGATIRINEAQGMRVYIAPNATVSEFNTLDTAGWQSWHRLHDSDSSIEFGAFNNNRNTTDIFDFGWGKYDFINHNVNGDSVYLIQLPNGELKKFMVIALVYDTAFDLQYANIDNSNLQATHISKLNYQGKGFVYFNLYNNAIYDKEPFSTEWDIQGMRYAAGFPNRDSVILQTGVWLNKGTTVAKVTGTSVINDYYFNYSFADSLAAIGWDWQVYDSFTQTYQVKDSLAYFIQTQSGQVYKLIFTAFRGSSTGEMCFYSQLLSSTTAIDAIKYANALNLYPNPANNFLNVSTGSTSATLIKVFDVTGNLLSQNWAAGSTAQVNTSLLPDGIYLLNISSAGKTAEYRKFVVSH